MAAKCCAHAHTHIYIYIYIHTHAHTHTHTHTHTAMKTPGVTFLGFDDRGALVRNVAVAALVAWVRSETERKKEGRETHTYTRVRAHLGIHHGHDKVLLPRAPQELRDNLERDQIDNSHARTACAMPQTCGVSVCVSLWAGCSSRTEPKTASYCQPG
jgi:hypothetical protein